MQLETMLRWERAGGNENLAKEAKEIALVSPDA
jgi:hypothetical protein